jgi:hypothetical protein
LDLRSLIDLGGFLGKGQDTRISPHITTFSRGLSAKLPISFFLLTERSGANRGEVAGPAKTPALRQTRSSTRCGIGRGAREGCGEVLTAVGGEGMWPDFEGAAPVARPPGRRRSSGETAQRMAVGRG